MNAMDIGNGADGVDLNVSASETSKGGVKYEVVISKPAVNTPPRSISPSHGVIKPIVSAEMIQQKLQLAAERRQSLESEKLASLAEKWRKVDEAAKKRVEDVTNFINSTKENLEQKMETFIENRESIITDLKTKLSNHNTNHLLEVRQNMETSVIEFEEKVKEEVAKKLEQAEINRDNVIQSKLDLLKKHDEKLEQARSLKRNSSVLESGSTEDAPTTE